MPFLFYSILFALLGELITGRHEVCPYILYINIFFFTIYSILDTIYYILILFIGFNKFFNRAVISPLHLGREQTSRKLAHIPMISNAFTAFALSTAGFVGTGTISLVFFNNTFHYFSSILF